MEKAGCRHSAEGISRVLEAGSQRPHGPRRAGNGEKNSGLVRAVANIAAVGQFLLPRSLRQPFLTPRTSVEESSQNRLVHRTDMPGIAGASPKGGGVGLGRGQLIAPVCNFLSSQ